MEVITAQSTNTDRVVFKIQVKVNECSEFMILCVFQSRVKVRVVVLKAG